MPGYNRRATLADLFGKGFAAGAHGTTTMMNRNAEDEAALEREKIKAAAKKKEDSSLALRTLAQKRAETVALNKVYNDQTKGVREHQDSLDQIAPLLKDPTNIDDQQLRRQMAMAVNKGTLTDKDVEDALPSDIITKGKQAYNWIQPVLKPLGAEKATIYGEDTVHGIQKLLQGKRDTLDKQLADADNQVQQMAPYVAPTISAEEPQSIAGLIQGIKGVRGAQQKRITSGLAGGNAPGAQEAPPVGGEGVANAGPPQRTVVKTQTNARTGQKRTVYSDGSVEVQ
jgi:hypothetical protein